MRYYAHERTSERRLRESKTPSRKRRCRYGMYLSAGDSIEVAT